MQAEQPVQSPEVTTSEKSSSQFGFSVLMFSPYVKCVGGVVTVSVLVSLCEYCDYRVIEMKSIRTSRLVNLWTDKSLVLVVIATAVALIGAWQYRWICDDAMINFHIIGNLVHGNGPVFNVGERTEVYSDALWVLTLTIVRMTARFLPLGWSAVLLGLACSAAGFYFAGRASLLLRRNKREIYWPVGLFTLAAIPVMWEFITSGLETGMTFGWIGVSYFFVVRRSMGVGSRSWTAILLGLGLLIRPDLVIFVLWLLATWLLTDDTLQRADTTRNFRMRFRIRYVLIASVLPVGYEIFRMAYFGLLVPNTGLVKSATSLWWSQGFAYLLNLFNPYWLWIPVAILIAVQLHRAYEYKANHRAMLLVLSPVVAGLLSITYYTAIGGDFMHGRLLLPGLFCLLMGASVSVTSWRRAVPVVLVAVWSVVCVSALRWGVAPPGATIGDERTVAMWQSHSVERSKHPITAADYAQSKWYRFGIELRDGAAKLAPGSNRLVLGANPSLFVPLPTELPPIVQGHSGLGSSLIAATRPIGQVGFAAGSRVYIFDELSLANPVSSHFIVHVRSKPGHEKVASMAWYLGRFGQPGDVDQLNRYRSVSYFEEVTASDVVAARAALSCGQLRVYLRGITDPLTPNVMMSNIWHALSNTTMKFDPNPALAQRQLCHG